MSYCQALIDKLTFLDYYNFIESTILFFLMLHNLSFQSIITSFNLPAIPLIRTPIVNENVNVHIGR